MSIVSRNFNIMLLTVVGVVITTPREARDCNNFVKILLDTSLLRSNCRVNMRLCIIDENVERMTLLLKSSSAGGTT
jgi:hypothetical protein